MTPTALRPSRLHSLSAGHHRADTALYVARLSGELCTLAKQAKLEMAAYFLEMAQIEANSVAFEDQPPHNSW